MQKLIFEDSFQLVDFQDNSFDILKVSLIRTVMSLDESILATNLLVIIINTMSVINMTNKMRRKIIRVPSWSCTANWANNFEMLIILEFGRISAVMATLKISYHMINQSINTFAY